MAKQTEVNGWTKERVKVWIKDADITDFKTRCVLTRALDYLFTLQTADEQSTLETSHSNGQGFTGVDAPFLSSVALKARETRRPITEKQAVYVQKKLQKYSGQLLQFVKAPVPNTVAS
jgi:hypothetical protein